MAEDDTVEAVLTDHEAYRLFWALEDRGVPEPTTEAARRAGAKVLRAVLTIQRRRRQRQRG